MTTRLWLLGQGIEHSPSPAMHNAALRACGLDWEYSIRDVAPAEVRDVVDELRAGRAVGCNVTIPHKRAVAALCDSLQSDAASTGSVNTVVRGDDGALTGHNTDARGFENALRHDGLWPEAGTAALVLGAGGAAAAVVLALSRAGIRVAQSARRREAAGTRIPFVAWERHAVLDALAGPVPALLVNATPAALGDLPVDVAALPDTKTVVDLRYRYGPDDLVPAARARGLRAAGGLEMLLQQAMLSFTLWTGLDAPADVARRALHAAVGAG